MIKVDTTHAFLREDVGSYQGIVTECHNMLMKGTGKGNDFIGWVEWPNNYDKKEFARIKEVAEKIRNKCDVFVVCGVGGSYLGARAAIEMINGLYSGKKPEIIFLGNTFSSTYISQALKYMKDKEVCVNVISKSGTTTETSLAFRMLKRFMEDKYGKEEAATRIVATTDKEKGTLKEIATKEGYETFVIPDNIGGRYSVITPVGLFPIAVAGIDIDAIMVGLKKAYDDLASDKLEENPAYVYAVSRRILEKQEKNVEMFITYEPQMEMVAEWWKQLFGESEGKEGKGNFPISATFTTDLHSIGQFIQEGKKVIYETSLLVENPTIDFKFPSDEDDVDCMNYLAGKSIDWVNKMAARGTLEAHSLTGHVPNITLTIPDMGPESFGYMCYFFFKACAISCYMLDINPFNQPGVDVYKKHMFRLLGKI